MHKKFSLAILAASAALLWSSGTAFSEEQPQPKASFPHSPFPASIFGTGIVEPSSENIFIGSPVQRIVEKILVKVGAKINKGDVLIRLEDRDLQAELLVQLAAFKIAQAKVQRLQEYPRPEDLSSAEAAVRNAEADVWLAKSQYDALQGLQDARAVSQDERNRRRFNAQQAEARLQEAQANLNKIKVGTWEPDLEIARLQVQQAKADVDRVKVNIQRTAIRSPITGQVLQIKINEGELPPLDTFQIPLMIVGNTDEKNLKVSINQFNASAFRAEARAVAFLQGNANVEYPLEFIRIEPYLVDKRNLTNEITEKVDTRVLNIIYRIAKDSPNLLVGQQMDVFIERQE